MERTVDAAARQIFQADRESTEAQMREKLLPGFEMVQDR